MKIKLLSLLLLAAYSLTALQIKPADDVMEITTEHLSLQNTEILTTQKQEDGITATRIWQGLNLRQLLAEHKITSYDQIIFTSDDNYLVRLTEAEILETDPILAFFLNDEKLEDAPRLVAANLAPMYWIRNITLIETESSPILMMPSTLFFAENHLSQLEIITEPHPFTKVKGYFLKQIIQPLMPTAQGQFLLIGKDGVSHRLDYAQYLQNAVLVHDNNGYILQSPDMPGGMWIKNIACIQRGETAIIFREQFSDWQELKELVEWNSLPDTINIHIFKKEPQNISTDLDFSHTIWQKADKLSW